MPLVRQLRYVFGPPRLHRPTDEVNQYFICNNCEKPTYDLIAKTARDMRLGRFRAGGFTAIRRIRPGYQVSRVLKVGLNEYLVYLGPSGPPPNPRSTISGPQSIPSGSGRHCRCLILPESDIRND